MNRLTLALLTIILLSGCSVFKNTTKYNDLCQTAISDLIIEDYDKVLESFSTQNADSAQISNFKKGLKEFRKFIVDNFGEKFDLKFITSTKKFSTADDVQNVTTMVIQLSNQTHYGYFDIIMDDSVGKIKNITLRDFKDEIPNTLLFWLLSVVPLTVLGLNIYTIRKIVKSDFSRKWLLILICIALNWPTLNIYLTRLSLEFAFQMLLGAGFNLMGYDNYVWSFGIPIGALISLYAIRPSRTVKNETEIIES